MKQRKGCRMSCDVGKAAEGGLRLILQPLHRFTYITAHSPTLPPLYLTSQLILQPFLCITYVIGISPTSKLVLQPFRHFTYVTGHSTTLSLLHLRHRLSRTSPGEPPIHRGMKNQSMVDVKNFTTSSKLIFLQSYSV